MRAQKQPAFGSAVLLFGAQPRILDIASCYWRAVPAVAKFGAVLIEAHDLFCEGQIEPLLQQGSVNVRSEIDYPNVF